MPPLPKGAKPIDEMPPLPAGAVSIEDNKPINNPFQGDTIQAAPTGVVPWFQQAEEDLIHGGGRTVLGRALGHLQGRGDKGYAGLEAGVSPGVAEYMGSPELGVMQAGKGLAETATGHPLTGLKDVGVGALKAATIPASFIGPEASEAALDAIPTRAKAGRLLDEVRSAVNARPEGPLPASGTPLPQPFSQVGMTRTLPAIERAQRLSEEGHGAIGALDRLYNRINTTNPLDYDEAFSRRSALGTLTGEDKMRATPSLKAAAKQVYRALGEDIGDTAERAGVGRQYRQGMRTYRQAMQTRNALINAGKWALPVAGGAAAYHFLKPFIPER